MFLFIVTTQVDCLQTKSYPNPKISWVVANTIDDKNPTSIVLDKRIQQDPKGQ